MPLSANHSRSDDCSQPPVAAWSFTARMAMGVRNIKVMPAGRPSSVSVSALKPTIWICALVPSESLTVLVFSFSSDCLLFTRW